MRKVLSKSLWGVFCVFMGLGWLHFMGTDRAEAQDGPKVTPYGLVEFDVVYSSRNTNPLDPKQFNGYATAAHPSGKATTTFNPRFTLLGVKGEMDRVKAVGEFDFYGSDGIGLIAPRLRLGYIQYTTPGGSKTTLGMDWLPIMASHPNAYDFSIYGYTGNLWMRIPQVTHRYPVSEDIEVLGTLFRNERSGFDDDARMPYVGARAAYTGWGLWALSGAYRAFEHSANEENVVSWLGGVEFALPLDPLSVNGEFAVGQGLGAEFFRFGQGAPVAGKPGNDGGTEPIGTVLGFVSLGYAATEALGIAAGYGFDLPSEDDLKDAGISDFDHYKSNMRVYGNATYNVYGGFKLGLEVTEIITTWSDADETDETGQQYMLVSQYAF